MSKRKDLQKLLEQTLGSRNVYFQPPATIKMQYPAIRYELVEMHTKRADDSVYRAQKAYTLTLISKSSEDPTFDKLVQLPLCRFDRHYCADGLSHDVFKSYY